MLYKFIRILFCTWGQDKFIFFPNLIYNNVKSSSTINIADLKGLEILYKEHYVKSVQIRSYFWSVFSYIQTEQG